MESEKGYMQIGEVAESTGLTHRTLRYYEEKGLLKPPSRMEGGFRLYTEDDVQRIKHIRQLIGLLGFSLAEIKDMADAEETLEQLRAERKQGGISPEQKIAKLRKSIEVAEMQANLVNQKVEQLSELRFRLEQKLTRFRSTLSEWEQA
ncbi:MAG: MerR family transcriptional regulator, partial [Dehalococcoidia bacterium]|nr:MerR family transcriptional regulator [Dehalococcoidia bacterium]